MRKITFALLAGAISALATVAYAENPMVGGAAMYANKNIVENAVNSKDHTTLVAAVKAAGLVKTLEGKGPFTVFAPTNEAFAALPKGTVETLLKPENKDKLTAILKNHVVAGKVMAADVQAGAVPTLRGGDVVIAVEDGSVKYGDATVIATDVAASNGVIHVIDTVVIPD